MNGDGNSPEGSPYHWLTVKKVCDETSEARSFVLVPKRGEAALYNYEPGQFLTFRIPHESGEITRSYSLSSAPCTDPDMTVCVKRVTDGRGSNWFNDHLIAGARIETTRPAGRFVLRDNDAPLMLIAGGSGITPCISLIKHALVETRRKVKLVYANRNKTSVIYSNVLNILENRYVDRFTCQHWFDDRLGFMTPADIEAAGTGWEACDSYICGPDPLMDMAEETLGSMFGTGAKILIERFVSPDDNPDTEATAQDQVPPVVTGVDSFRLTIDGEDRIVPIAPGETLLDAALSAGIDAPRSCTEGHCGTCMAWLRSGDVSMGSTRALSKRNIERGYVLACKAQPASTAPLWLDFDL